MRDRDVDRPVGQRSGQFAPGALQHIDLQVSAIVDQRLDGRGEYLPGNTCNRANPHHPAARTAHHRHGFVNPRHFMGDRPCNRNQRLTRLGQPHAQRVALKQAQAAMPLKLVDHPAQRGLGQMHFLGGAAQAAKFDNLEKGAKLTMAEAHVSTRMAARPLRFFRLGILVLQLTNFVMMRTAAILAKDVGRKPRCGGSRLCGE